MASKALASSPALFLALNLLFCSVVTSTQTGGSGGGGAFGNGGSGSGSGGNGSGSGGSGSGGGSNGSGNGGSGSGGGSNGSGNGGSGSGGGSNGSGNGGSGSGGGSNGSGNGGSGSGSGTVARCPRDALKLGVCANVLNLVNVVVGSPPTLPCCSLLQGLVNLEAAACLCTAIRANILGINLNLPISLSLVLNNCGRQVPSGFQC